MELHPVNLDEVDRYERATPLGLERIRQVFGQPLRGERLGPGARRASVPHEWLRGPHPVDQGVIGENRGPPDLGAQSAISP